mgnify:FL=1
METETIIKAEKQSRHSGIQKSVCNKKLWDYQQLTRREIQIIHLVVTGLTDKEIANVLKVSFHTVRSHRKNIFQKTNQHNIGSLIFYAMQHHLLEQQTFSVFINKNAIIYN